MPKHSFILNGERVTVDCQDDLRLLWVIRDLLGVRGPKYGCGINVCKACTCHINGKAFNPCSVPVSKIKRSDEITTIEGLPGTVGKDLHPMQSAWLKMDVAQCGYCQPGQIMQAVSLVNEVRRKEGRRSITNRDIESIRNVCRCGTYPRIREAIKEGAKHMPNPPKAKRKKAAKKKKAKPSSAPAATPAPTTAATPSAAAPTTVVPDVPAVDDVLDIIQVG
jgi:isoquinoline 1-oxidoreductase alpha subunit